MQNEIGIAKVLELTGAGKATIYRWMNRHPTLATADGNSAKGHPFPKPIKKLGREVFWDEAAVQAWWDANEDLVGRHTRAKAFFRLPAGEIAEILSKLEQLDEREASTQDYAERQGDRKLIKSIEYDGDEATLHFRSASDAVYFRLKRTGRRSF